MRLVGEALLVLINVALGLLLARALFSWFKLLFPSVRLPEPVVKVFDFLHRITEPPLKWLRRYLRPVGMGEVSLDLSFMVWFVVLLLAQRIVAYAFF